MIASPCAVELLWQAQANIKTIRANQSETAGRQSRRKVQPRAVAFRSWGRTGCSRACGSTLLVSHGKEPSAQGAVTLVVHGEKTYAQEAVILPAHVCPEYVKNE
jgi:hypothetical protein